MSDATTHLLLPYILAAQAQKHVTHNEALRILDGLVHLSVLDRNLTAPPGSPADGDRYIVGSGATGDWAGWDLNVALWTDGAWLRLPPRTGWRAWVEDEGLLLVYDGAGWIGTTPAALQNMALFGVGTTADASNPFSAKLNAALWTAKTVAEGGTGDLFYTMNKEAAGDDLGLTLQTGFVTKALVGLFGSDRFRLAVSDDGSSFFDGLSVDNATGIVDQPRLPRFKAYTNYDNYVGVGVRYGAIVVTVLLFLLSLRRFGERTGRLAERLKTTENANDVQRRMLEAAARRPLDRDELADRLRDGHF